MDLIDREALIETLRKDIKEKNTDGQSIRFKTGTIYRQIEAIKIIENQPTVDAVPVVRCKNCTRWGTGVAGETEYVKCCEYAKYMVGENGYCCYGADMRTSAE